MEDGQEPGEQRQSAVDMSVFVQNLLGQMQSRFQTMSSSIVQKIDEMGGRIDELEQSINNLKAEMGVENEAPADKTGEKEPANTKDQKDE